jgi:hypothetical protein
MSDEITNVDDIVIAHAAKMKENAGGENQEKVIEKVDPPAGGTEQKKDPVDPLKDKQPDPPAASNPVDDLLKELDLESLDALRERLKPKDPAKPESPEEKTKRESLYEASLQKHAVEKGAMKLEDFTTLQNLKSKDDKSLVFEKWLTEWKEENPNVDALEVDRLAKEEFESEYKLNSDNEKAKARGLSKIEREAKELRTPLEKAYAAVKENYDGVRDLEVNFPEFNKKVTALSKEFIPEKFTVFKVKDKVGDKEEDVNIEVELTPADRVEILNAVGKSILNEGNYVNAANYDLYKKGDFRALQALAKEKAEGLIAGKYRDAAAQKIATEFLSRGTKRGSTTGATNPFPLEGDGKKTDEKGGQSARDQIMNQPAFKR